MNHQRISPFILIKNKYDEFVSNPENKNSVDLIWSLRIIYERKGTSAYKEYDRDYLPISFFGHKITKKFEFNNIILFYPLIGLISHLIDINITNQEFIIVINNLSNILGLRVLNTRSNMINYGELIRLIFGVETLKIIEKLNDSDLLNFFVYFDSLYKLVEKEFFLNVWYSTKL